MKTNQPKNVQKSIRISEDVLKYIEKQEGNGFNEKLCNMVLYCMEHEADIKKKVSAAEKMLEVVEKQIGEKEELLEKLESISRFVGSCLRVIQ
ncbi:MAG: hypothetical protein OSJ61_20610 [Lachnospiraceae bacterium]|nr:hypothetical protein [Lachnospiraceae bacterium]